MTIKIKKTKLRRPWEAIREKWINLRLGGSLITMTEFMKQEKLPHETFWAHTSKDRWEERLAERAAQQQKAVAEYQFSQKTELQRFMTTSENEIREKLADNASLILSLGRMRIARMIKKAIDTGDFSEIDSISAVDAGRLVVWGEECLRIAYGIPKEVAFRFDAHGLLAQSQAEFEQRVKDRMKILEWVREARQIVEAKIIKGPWLGEKGSDDKP